MFQLLSLVAIAVIVIFGSSHDAAAAAPTAAAAAAAATKHTTAASSTPLSQVAVTLRRDALQAALKVVALNMSNSINATPMPSQSGSAPDGVHYTFSDFSPNLFAGTSFTLSNDAKSGLFNVTFNDISFNVQWKYDICKKLIKERAGLAAHATAAAAAGAAAGGNESRPLLTICEKGYISAYTSGNSSVPISVMGVLNFLGPKVFVNVTNVHFAATEDAQNRISVFVQCTSTVCAIPVKDIANSVWSGFPAAVDAGVRAAIDYYTPQLDAPTTQSLGSELLLALNGSLALSANGPCGAAVRVDGRARAAAKPRVFFPPRGVARSPQLHVPDDWLSSPAPAQLGVFVGGGALRAAAYAATVQGLLNRTLDNSQLPPNLPFTLNTDDVALLAFAPGLSAYPGLNMSVSLFAAANEVARAPAAVDAVNASIGSVWRLLNVNGTAHNDKVAFELSTNVSFTYSLTVKEDRSQVNVTLALDEFADFASTAIHSAIGTVSTYLFDAALDAFVDFDKPVLPPFAFPLPSSALLLSNATLQTNVSNAAEPFFIVSANIALNDSDIPYTACKGGDLKCASDNTCCKWGTSYGCCMAKSAECCSTGGCCESGTHCCGNGECCYDAPLPSDVLPFSSVKKVLSITYTNDLKRVRVNGNN